MTSLSRRAEAIHDDGDAHAHIADVIDWHERFRGTGCDTREILAQQTGGLIGKQHRRAVYGAWDDGARRTGPNAITALGAALEERRLFHGARRSKPIGSTGRRRLRHHGILLLPKLLC